MNKEKDNGKEDSSFRDPSGFVFVKDNELYRQINESYKEDYELLMSSGLYEKLVSLGLLVKHEEVEGYRVIKPEKINFISYAYEWCFSQLKDAALVTLKIQKLALEHGMILKDCSAYNIQFRKGNAILIDTLSFEKFKKGEKWVGAYRQFCRHFLGPLALMSYVNINLVYLLKNYIDGIPLEVSDSLLPFRTYFNSTLLYHLHMNAKTYKNLGEKRVKEFEIDKENLVKIVEGLEKFISKLKPKVSKTEWSDYYEEKPYGEGAFEHKKEIVKGFLEKIKSKEVMDLGANTGEFSKISEGLGCFTISVDNDALAVEKNYLENKDKEILPLVVDIVNPSAGIGWENKERLSFLERINPDTVLALALVHHLAISNNLPFSKIASLFSKMGKYLIIEFIPKNDAKVQRLLSRREDIFDKYNEEEFEKEFGKKFVVLEKINIKESGRSLYLMKLK